jgi:hypothetical protein
MLRERRRLRICRDRRWHPDQHCHDLVRAADGQKHRPRRGGRGRRQPSATLTAALASNAVEAYQISSVDVSMWACIAPAQAAAARFGARLAPYLSAAHLSQILALALATTGAAMLRSSLLWIDTVFFAAEMGAINALQPPVVALTVVFGASGVRAYWHKPPSIGR